MVLKLKFLLIIVLVFPTHIARAQSAPQNVGIQAKKLLDQCQYREAAALFGQALADTRDHEQQGVEYALNLAGYAEAIQATDFNKADSLYVKSLAIISKITGQEVKYAQVLQNLAEVRMMLQKFEGVEQMLDSAMKLKAQTFGFSSIEYAEALGSIGWYYATRSDFTKANKAVSEAIEIVSKKAPNSFTHGVILQRAFILAFYQQNSTEAERLCSETINIFQKTCHPSHRRITEAKGNMALLYLQTKRIDQARKTIVELLQFIEREYGKQDYIYAVMLSSLGSINAFEGNAPAAIPMFEESIALNKRLFGELHDSHTSALNNLAMLYTRVDDLEKAEALLLESLRIRKQLHGESNSHYIQALNNLAVLYQGMGSYTRSIEQHRKAAELSKTVLGESSRSYIFALSNIALCNLSAKKYDQALEFAILSEQIIEKYNLGQKTEFIELRAKHLLIKMRCGELTGKSVAQVVEAAKRIKELYGEKNTTYQNIINALSLYYYEAQNYDLALKYALIDNQLTKQYRGQDSFAHLVSLNNIGASCYQLKQMPQAEAALNESLEVMKGLMLKNFIFMSGNERENYWHSIQQTVRIIDEFIGITIKHNYNTPAIKELAYNSTLLTKALLLNYSTNVQRSILQSDEVALISIWEQLKKQKQSPTKNPEQIEVLERKLAAQSKPYQEQQSALSITWQEVQKSLKAGEAAIEITSVPINGLGSKLHYIALVIRPEYESPQLVMLCDQGTIEGLLSTSSYLESELYAGLFAPMEKYLNGVKTLYIAGAGLTNRISFAGLKHNGVYLIDKYSIHNILSTRDIIRIKEEQNFVANNISLFGGADFALSYTELAQSNVIKPAQQPTNELLSEKIDLSRGQGFDYLPGSKQEVVEIGNILNSHGWETNTYTDIKATETQFKQLSSAAIDIIHVATHGYYFPLKSDQEKPTNHTFKFSDDPLIRSGLLFSGANNIWSADLKSDSTDDGVLTGSEISLMDLSQTKLVVLSACNTALGDIDYVEGVYGLQRAFRMAGVESMLLSLWEISDKETILFMTTFYTNLSGGYSIKEAFESTTRKMRLEHPANPKLWAGFVLIE